MSERSKGSDSQGTYIVWKDSKGQINKKYISGDAKDTHIYYDPNTTRMGASYGDGSKSTLQDLKEGFDHDAAGYPN